MKPMGTERRHYWRTLKMAGASGVPLATALQDGFLNRGDYAEMITLCRRCTHIGGCDAMLAKAITLPAPPEFCGNRDILMALRPD